MLLYCGLMRYVLLMVFFRHVSTLKEDFQQNGPILSIMKMLKRQIRDFSTNRTAKIKLIFSSDIPVEVTWLIKDSSNQLDSVSGMISIKGDNRFLTRQIHSGRITACVLKMLNFNTKQLPVDILTVLTSNNTRYQYKLKTRITKPITRRPVENINSPTWTGLPRRRGVVYADQNALYLRCSVAVKNESYVGFSNTLKLFRLQSEKKKETASNLHSIIIVNREMKESIYEIQGDAILSGERKLVTGRNGDVTSSYVITMKAKRQSSRYVNRYIGRYICLFERKNDRTYALSDLRNIRSGTPEMKHIQVSVESCSSNNLKKLQSNGLQTRSININYQLELKLGHNTCIRIWTSNLSNVQITFRKIGSTSLPDNVNLLYLPDLSLGAVNQLIVNFRTPFNQVSGRYRITLTMKSLVKIIYMNIIYKS